jgi:hypothetical protein
MIKSPNNKNKKNKNVSINHLTNFQLKKLKKNFIIIKKKNNSENENKVLSEFDEIYLKRKNKKNNSNNFNKDQYLIANFNFLVKPCSDLTNENTNE